MPAPVLATKLFIPPSRPGAVLRPRLIEQLNAGLRSKLTLISAPAGFGKTTLVSEWVAGCERPAAWLSLDEGDNDPSRFLVYLFAALQTIAGRQSPPASIGEGVLAVLQSPQPPPVEPILTNLLNEITAGLDLFILVLDDYHVIDAKPVNASTSANEALTFLLDHLPPQMHLVIVTREDPPLPLARYRARGQLTELRAAELRFTPAEAADFLNRTMGLDLSPEEVTALEARTEGWIAGLQLAALALQGTSVAKQGTSAAQQGTSVAQQGTSGTRDTASFIQSFTGSHHFVMDYLVEEVLQQQPESIQAFLLHTSILDRLCGPLCDAVLLDGTVSGQETLEYLERANLFILPLDNKRRWYRYHHLFAGLLRQRLSQQERPLESAASHPEDIAAEYHRRASGWFEENGLEIEAFQHAAAANDVERAERLIQGKGIPLHLRGAVTMILDWLASLPKSVLDSRPSLWWRYGSLLLVNGQTTGVEEKLDAAEAALLAQEQSPEPSAGPDDETRNLAGQIATARSVLALTRYDVETMMAQSRRALELLHPGRNNPRATARWVQGFAYLIQGDRPAARRSLTEAISLSQVSGDVFTTILATIGLGTVQEAENQLYQAAETYRGVLEAAGDQPLQVINEAHLGLARVLYEWNDLEAAGQHARQSLLLARQYDRVIDRFVISEVFLARLKLAQGDVAGASAVLAQAGQTARRQNFVHRIPEVAAVQVIVLLRQGDLAGAARLAQAHGLPLSQARVHLAQGDPKAALAVLEPWHRQVEARGLADERLKGMVLQAAALQAHDETEEAVRLLGDALSLAEPGGFIRTFVDEGPPLAGLLAVAAARGIMPDYAARLLAVFEAEERKGKARSAFPASQPLVEPLSPRELEVLTLIAQGLSNQEISERLFLALSTVKGHNLRIFGKLQVQRRTEAVRRARELGLL